MNNIKELTYLEKLLKEKECPLQLVTPYAMQILIDCKNNKKSVYDIEIV